MLKLYSFIKLHKKKVIAAWITVVVLMVSLFGSIAICADTVTVEEYQNPELAFVKINGRDPTFGVNYDSVGTFTTNTDGYTMVTNSHAPWYEQDHVDFAYKTVRFGFDEDSDAVLTVECRVDSWSGYAKTAGAGIMIRSSLAPDAAMAFIHARPEAILTVYRMQEKLMANASTYGPVPSYPVDVRLVLSNGKVSTYYKFANQTNFVQLSKGINFVYDDTIYVGIAAHSSDQNDVATAVFKNLDIKVEANEGWQYEEGDPDGGDTSTPDTSSEPEVVLPEDLPAAGNVLLRETFTDNSMFDGEASATNPIWTTNNAATKIITNEEATNRYLSLSYLDAGYYYAGSTDWTDYSYEADVTFTEDVLVTEPNRLTFFTRFKYNLAHGISGYTVTFNNDYKKNSRTVTLGYINMASRMPEAGYQLAWETKDFDYFANLGQTNKIKIDALDNHITVYWNNQLLFDFVDDLTVLSDHKDRIDIHCTGNIGFAVQSCSVELDNLVVKKLEDPLGGDYDNRIGGRFNEPIPDYLKTYDDNDWNY